MKTELIVARCRADYYDEEYHEKTFLAGQGYTMARRESQNYPYLATDKNGNKKLFSFMQLIKHFAIEGL